MLISCPKCHSIYEIPDDLIPRTGQNFRCQACANVWHAMREDAIGYTEETDEKPYIEAITVKEPPIREYPANKKKFTVPADSKSGIKTRSSKEILAREGDPDYTPPAPKKKKELTLTSDFGTSFTISTDIEEDKVTPRLFSEKSAGLSANADNRLLPKKPFKGYKKTYLLLYLLALSAFFIFMRREVTAIYPAAEVYYNQIGLSGINNPQYLKFEQINIAEETNNNTKTLNISAMIHNDSYYITVVPPVIVNGKTFQPERSRLKANEKTTVKISLPIVKEKTSENLTLSFQKP